MEFYALLGFFHTLLSPRYRGSLRILNVFSFDTNEDWKTRRAKFRHPFSSSTLRRFENDVKALVSVLNEKIRSYVLTGVAVEIDKLFGQLTMDAICRIAFAYELHALEDSSEFNFLHRNLQTFLEVIVARSRSAEYVSSSSLSTREYPAFSISDPSGRFSPHFSATSTQSIISTFLVRGFSIT